MLKNPDIELHKKAVLLEQTVFDARVDLDIIGAYETDRAPKISVSPGSPATYRCHFIEHDVLVTYLTHMLAPEYEMLIRIIKGRFNFNPSIRVYALRDSRVESKNIIDAGTLAHILFRFHHRIAKKYIAEEVYIF